LLPLLVLPVLLVSLASEPLVLELLLGLVDAVDDELGLVDACEDEVLGELLPLVLFVLLFELVLD